MKIVTLKILAEDNAASHLAQHLPMQIKNKNNSLSNIGTFLANMFPGREVLFDYKVSCEPATEENAICKPRLK